LLGTLVDDGTLLTFGNTLLLRDGVADSTGLLDSLALLQNVEWDSVDTITIVVSMECLVWLCNRELCTASARSICWHAFSQRPHRQWWSEASPHGTGHGVQLWTADCILHKKTWCGL
jgi:hypothetical protein